MVVWRTSETRLHRVSPCNHMTGMYSSAVFVHTQHISSVCLQLATTHRAIVQLAGNTVAMFYVPGQALLDCIHAKTWPRHQRVANCPQCVLSLVALCHSTAPKRQRCVLSIMPSETGLRACRTEYGLAAYSCTSRQSESGLVSDCTATAL